MNETLPIPHTTVAQLAGVYRKAKADIEQAFTLLYGARETLTREFGSERYGFAFAVKHSRRNMDCATADELMDGLKIDAWRILIDKMDLRRVLSIKRAEELDKQLETGEGLPEIDELQILAMLEGTLLKAPDYLAEAAKEVFDWLRPNHTDYKTNDKWKVGERVVLGYCVKRKYGSRGFRIDYHRQQNLTALENVFLMLDGKGSVKTSHGALRDVIDASETGHGETEYFEFRCYKNRNLHLRFKRLDLVDKLNQTSERQLPG